jgi:ADP-ribosylglycohydrolase
MSTTIEDRCIGVVLCHMIGDQLGAGVEGFSASRIKRDHGIVRDDIEALHMGIPELGPRIHTYTDDTNAMLALAQSLVANDGLRPKHAARSYAEFWSTGIKRGYPDSAQENMGLVLLFQLQFIDPCNRLF